ncbi:hypothetical protein FGB62_288g03 [Gracilaria domingensis]|nr:hypothetical protein FGB62_288g03 [Gracilaria domingensis]
MKRDCPHYRRGKKLHQTLYNSLNDANPEGEATGENAETVQSILNAALADCADETPEHVINAATAALAPDETHESPMDNTDVYAEAPFDINPNFTNFLQASSTLHVATASAATDHLTQPF